VEPEAVPSLRDFDPFGDASDDQINPTRRPIVGAAGDFQEEETKRGASFQNRPWDMRKPRWDKGISQRG